MNDTDILPENAEIAIMSEVGFGMRDFRGDAPGLWFSVQMKGGMGALICLFGEDMARLLRDNCVYDIRDLKNKLCYVVVEDGLVRFVRLARELLAK